MTKVFCEHCGNECFGIWKIGQHHACSKKCYRILVANGTISTIPPYAGFPELGIHAPKGKDERKRAIEYFLNDRK